MRVPLLQVFKPLKNSSLKYILQHEYNAAGSIKGTLFWWANLMALTSSPKHGSIIGLLYVHWDVYAISNCSGLRGNNSKVVLSLHLKDVESHISSPMEEKQLHYMMGQPSTALSDYYNSWAFWNTVLQVNKIYTAEYWNHATLPEEYVHLPHYLTNKLQCIHQHLFLGLATITHTMCMYIQCP